MGAGAAGAEGRGNARAAAAAAAVRAWDRDRARPMVRVEGDDATVVDGSAEGIAGLAAFGALGGGRLALAGDLAPASCATRARS